MKYPPQHHQEANFENCVYLAKEYPLATVISTINQQIHSSHLPLVYRENDSLGVFVGHLDKFNPQLEALEKGLEVELIFHGPEIYISPTTYRTNQLPTWNYFKAHFKGSPHIITDKETVKQSLISMTEVLEDNEQKYHLDPKNPRMKAALDYIIGFEITILAWEGKHKISQDKHTNDQLLAKEALLNKFPNNKKIINELYRNHQTKKTPLD